jgi:hypothetical protein
LFENLNLRLARSVSVRNALGRSEETAAREMATMLYGEVHGEFSASLHDSARP